MANSIAMAWVVWNLAYAAFEAYSQKVTGFNGKLHRKLV